MQLLEPLLASAPTGIAPQWLETIRGIHPVGAAVLVLALVATTGLALGAVKIQKIGLGIAGVLFSGIIFGHFRIGIDHHTLEFVRDFGLILFVYTIGMQVGPGFITSLQREGLPLNLMAASIVLLGAACTVLIATVGHIDMAAAVGLFSGATTNTPSLGAAQQALKSIPLVDMNRMELPALGYAVAYPFGIVGIIGSMIAFRFFFKIDAKKEAKDFHQLQQKGSGRLQRMNIEITNGNLNGVAIHSIPGKHELDVMISRIRFAGEDEVRAAKGEMEIHVGDTVLAVGSADHLEQFRLITGQRSNADLMKAPGEVTFRRMVVTRGEALGKSLSELRLNEMYDVTITRITRAGIEMPATGSLRLQFGDHLQVVGVDADIARVAEVVGNSSDALNHTNYVAVFIGIALGVLLGVHPIEIPGVPVPVRLGVAGGPLLAAILLSRLGRIGPVVWHMPDNANRAIRELGIILFLACVGLKAGDHFVEVICGGDGVKWMLSAIAITVVPLLAVAAFARLIWKQNFMNVCGLLAGSMTDPPALAFANTSAGSDAPSVAYAAVYPLTMLLRIVVAQLLVLLFIH